MSVKIQSTYYIHMLLTVTFTLYISNTYSISHIFKGPQCQGTEKRNHYI